MLRGLWTGSDRLSAVLWPIAGLTFLYVVIQALGEANTDIVPVLDAGKAFAHGNSPYANAGFVYAPSAGLLATPFGLLPLAAARHLFVLVTAGALVGSVMIGLRMVGAAPLGLAGAVGLAAIAWAEPTRVVVETANVNAIILLLTMGALLAASGDRWLVAGALFGLGLAIKPVLGPVLILFFVFRRWRAAAIAIAIPVVTAAIALLLVPAGAHHFFHETLRFIVTGKTEVASQKFDAVHENVSLKNAGLVLGLPSALFTLLRLAVVVAAGWLIVQLRRRPPTAETLLQVAGVLAIATLLCASVVWRHYAIFVLPLVVLLAVRGSVVRTWLGGLSIYLFATSDVWRSEKVPHFFDQLMRFRVTWGLLLLLATLILWTATRPAERAHPMPT